MKKLIAYAFVALFFFSPAHADQSVHWDYSDGPDGPAHWGDLSPDFAACKDGRKQSPVDVREPLIAELPPLNFAYLNGAAEVVNNGHSIQVDLKHGGSLGTPDGPYDLVQFHFHAPSEEELNGSRYPMVVHLVHSTELGHKAAVAVLFKIGRENPELARIFAVMPHRVGEVAHLDNVDPVKLLPDARLYYTLMGSLTTPPCNEGVRWFVLKQPAELSSAQLEQFRKLYPMNARPLQPLNDRVILRAEK